MPGYAVASSQRILAGPFNRASLKRPYSDDAGREKKGLEHKRMSKMEKGLSTNTERDQAVLAGTQLDACRVLGFTGGIKMGKKQGRGQYCAHLSAVGPANLFLIFLNIFK